MTAAEPKYERRKPLLEHISKVRGRAVVSIFHFDRPGDVPLPQSQFSPEMKEPLFRVLKETTKENKKVDVCLYSRGGDTNAVWPLVSLLREFDPDFQVLVPYRCHSAGTLLSLGAAKTVMSQLGELSPIDPSTGNQFNPVDPANPRGRLGISVEDVQAYRSFVLEQFRAGEDGKPSADRLAPFLAKLTELVHPLALGNVHRVHNQIKQLAKKLLSLHPVENEKTEDIIGSLTTRFYSHLHMISRDEAIEILGSRVEKAMPELDDALDALLREYEETFRLRKAFFLAHHVGDEPRKEVRFVNAVIESSQCSYLFETRGLVRQTSQLPPNVQVQIPAGQPLPLIPGVPRSYNLDVSGQGWVRNHEPKGVSL